MTEATAQVRRSPRRAGWIIVFTAVVIRLVMGFGLPYQDDCPDCKEYEQIAENLAAGHGYSLETAPAYAPTDWRLPAYPVLLAGLDGVAGNSDANWVILNALLGGVGAWLLWLIARRSGLTDGLALAAGLLGACYVSVASLAGGSLSDNLAVTAIVALVYVAFFRPFDGGRAFLLSFVAIGAVASLTRPEFVIVVLVSGVIASRRRGVNVWSMALVVFLVMVPPAAWAVRNSAEVGRFELADSVLPIRALAGAVETDYSAPIIHDYQRARSPGMSPDERSEYQSRVIAYYVDRVESDPVGFILSRAKSLVRFEIGSPGYAFQPETTTTLEESLRSLNPGAILRLGWGLLVFVQLLLAWGMLLVWWRKGRRSAAVAFALMPILSLVLVLPIEADYRYGLPGHYLLIVPAVAAIHALWERLKGSDHPDVGSRQQIDLTRQP